MITLYEAIIHCNELAEKHESNFKLCPYPSDICTGTPDCECLKNGKDKGYLKCAVEYRQFAEWLTELKGWRDNFTTVTCDVSSCRNRNEYGDCIFDNIIILKPWYKTIAPTICGYYDPKED